jgi:hypothetical protein
VTYWVLSLGLVTFGLVGMLSIGRPFFLVGLTMLLLGRVRRWPALFWPPLSAVVAYNVGYWAVAPFSCTATATLGGGASTVCSSLVGIVYAGPGIYNPSLAPANQVALALAVATFVVVLAGWLVSRAVARSRASG